MPYKIHVDIELAEACVAGSPGIGINARPLVIGSNDHDCAKIEQLGGMAAAWAAAQGKRVTVIGVGGLSGSMFRTEINLHEDAIASPGDDQ